MGAVFGEAKAEELHPQIIKMARKSGQLNLANKGLAEGEYVNSIFVLKRGRSYHGLS